MITTVLFDLDGTLLPMDQDVFINAYMGALAKKMAPYGYDPKRLLASIWKGTAAMVQNIGDQGNEDVFWAAFSEAYGRDLRSDEGLFLEFYQNEFQTVSGSCGKDPRAAQTIQALKEMGYTLALATNPLFPSIATYSRCKWAGLDPKDFALITTYENSSRCKPNPDYYREVLDKLGVQAEHCLMVGNDVAEDMIAEKLGMKVFLLTDCLINKHNTDISRYPNGSFPELLEYVRSL